LLYRFAVEQFRQQIFENVVLGLDQSLFTVLVLLSVNIDLWSRLDFLFFRDFPESSTEIRLIVIGVLPKSTIKSMPLLFNLSFLPILSDDVLNRVGRQGLQLCFKRIVSVSFEVLSDKSRLVVAIHE
jgi:hypothetical protein